MILLYYTYHATIPTMAAESFEWDENKNQENRLKHGVAFEEAQLAFADPKRLIQRDKEHSTPEESRFFCIGKVENKIMAVRFTYRDTQIRIFGAGFWRKYRKLYLAQSD